MQIPKDPFILLSYINTQLRDYYSNLTQLCESLDINEKDLICTLEKINYTYDKKQNQFM